MLNNVKPIDTQESDEAHRYTEESAETDPSPVHVRGNPSLIDLANRKGPLNMTDANFNLKKIPF